MARFGLDATAVLHGERAVRRNTRNLLQNLVRLHEDDEWALLYFDRSGRTPGRLTFTEPSSWSERISRLPMRGLLPIWSCLGVPAVESWLGAIDVFYAPDLYFPPARRAPVLCTVRGVAYLAIPEWCEPDKVRAFVKAMRYARRHASHFLAVSESTRQDLLRHTDLPPDRLHVVTHGVDPVFRRLDAAGSRDFVAQRFGLARSYLLYVGVIGRHKNILGLLQAWALAAPRTSGVDLVLAGPFEPEIHRAREFIARAGLTERVRFLGTVSQEDDTLVHLYNAALGLVFPTLYEGWCSPPLEAMACGIPVVASNIPSVREVVEDAAVLVPPQDVEAWAQAIIRLADDAVWRADLVERGGRHVKKHTWEGAARNLRRVLGLVQGASV